MIDPNNIKTSEYQRRYKHFAPQFRIDETTPIYGHQERFLSNLQNKKQLIKMLTLVLQSNGIEVQQAVGDADVLIVRTAVEKSAHFLPTIVTQDIDVLIIMIALASPERLY